VGIRNTEPPVLETDTITGSGLASDRDVRRSNIEISFQLNYTSNPKNDYARISGIQGESQTAGSRIVEIGDE
jgi:hypothetical protein